MQVQHAKIDEKKYPTISEKFKDYIDTLDDNLKHIWKPIKWTLIVDDFGFNYTNKRHVDELLKIMSQLVRHEKGLERRRFLRDYPQVEL